MSETADEVGGDASNAPAAPPTADDFRDSDLISFLESYQGSDGYEFEDALGSKASSAEPDSPNARVFSLIANLMSCHMQVDDPAEPFGPKLIMEGRRSMIPSDVRGDHTDAIVAILPTIPHPCVRARLGDIAFYNDRAHHGAGRIAIDAYCEVVTRRLAGTLACRIPDLAQAASNLRCCRH
jgi:hypothetical protein